MFCLGVLLGVAGCNSPAARSPAAAHPARPAPKPLPATLPTASPAAAFVQSVSFQYLTESASKPDCQDAAGNSRSLDVDLQFLHLLGPDTLRPAIQKLQCPPPAQRRALVQQELQQLQCGGEDEDTQYSSSASSSVNYNANGVLSLLVSESTDSGGAYPQTNNYPLTYDLATGKLCEVKQWLRPGKERAFRQLLTKYLMADSTGKDFVAYNTTDEEPKPYVVEQVPSLGLNDKGVYYSLGDLGAPHVIEGVDITIPYAALRSYVLPGTPLARVVAAHSR
ncbi:hypothetical protein GCM10022409_29620 [Hymenobacter glaciei]|uniref:DUF3298 domain-containing protein n=2 Tax=Hymenobacter glaciei TaxID=877209 RepID=A0ABP7UEN8_9BACT